MGKWDSSDEEEDTKKKEAPSKKQKIQKNASSNSLASKSSMASGKSSVVSSSKEELQAPEVSAAPVQESAQQSVVPAAPVEEEYNPLLLGCRSVECYQRLSFIDQGTYGMVFRAKDIKTGVVYALKQVKLGAETNKVGFPITALREINILMALRHPNIIKVKEMVVGSSIDKIFMVMEYCENDLKMCMETSKQSFSIAEIKQLMLQLLSAIDHMHRHWYIHRDLKTSNLLYSNKGVLCVCDFGLARKYGEPIAPYTFKVVTPCYRAPELLLGSRVYSTPIDMWSVGCIFAEMFLGDPIFPGKDEIDQMSKIFTALGLPNENSWPGLENLPNWSNVSKSLPTRGNIAKLFPTTASFSGGLVLNESGYDLLLKLLTLDSARRLTSSAALQHPWFKELPLPTPVENMPRFESKHTS